MPLLRRVDSCEVSSKSGLVKPLREHLWNFQALMVRSSTHRRNCYCHMKNDIVSALNFIRHGIGLVEQHSKKGFLYTCDMFCGPACAILYMCIPQNLTTEASVPTNLTNRYAFDPVTDRLAKTPNWKSVVLNLLDPKSRGIH